MSNSMSSEFDPAEAHFLSKLTKMKFWESFDIYQWKGFWFHPHILQSTMALQSEFKSRDDDVILASSLKVGTTWLKSLCLCILNSPSSNLCEDHEDFLTKASPHVHVPTMEAIFSAENPVAMISDLPSPRLLHTHLAHSLLPDSIKNSSCKIVYIARNPKDTLVSLWHHFNEIADGTHVKHSLPLEKAFECFCNGDYLHGPFFEHVLEYYLESLKMPEKIFFLRYEDLKTNPKEQVKKLASFLGKTFSGEDEVEKVLWRCSIERLKNLDVNKTGLNPFHGLPNSVFFRLGVTGDSENYLTPEMKKLLDEITHVKLEKFGLRL